MNGPHVEEVECPFCPCEGVYYVARCCTAIEQTRRFAGDSHRATYMDAHVDLANHLASVHGITPPLPADPDEPTPAPEAPSLFEEAS